MLMIDRWDEPRVLAGSQYCKTTFRSSRSSRFCHSSQYYHKMDLSKNDLREYIQDNGKALWTAHNNHHIRYFNEDEIRKITNNYSTLIGKGAFGEVYKGNLDDNSPVAVKRYIDNVKEDFAKEVIVHCEINHRNVVRLIGCCIGETALVMVTEYISKGNLSNILHCTEIPISLETRLDIAIGCAEALSYMHSQMYGQVIHGDIKPANILLDENLNAKVSDFGISKLLSTDKTLYITHVIGSIGYMDPLFARSGRLTSKSDVYSFGVVLLELITRRKAIDDEKISLTEIFTQALAKRKKMRELFDIEIADVNNLRILEEIGKLAAKCLAMETDKRPEMKEVAERLRVLRKAQYKRQEKVALFGWVWRSKQAPQNTFPGIDVVTDHVLRADAQAHKVHEAGTTENAEIIWIDSSKSIELEELLKASAEVLGKGKYGTTYKATLQDGSVFAVKRLKHVDVPEPVFKERMASICAIKHEIIVPLLGYYFSRDEKLLLYDYFDNGSLASNLHGKNMAPVDWETRSSIALSAARAVAHIHSSNTTTTHGNINSTNILLTTSYEARVSEYGLTALVSTATSVPSDIISQKADVYDFGILLLELLTGKSPHRHTEISEEPDMLKWVMSVPQDHWPAQVLDQKLLKNNDVEEATLQFLKIAIDCCEQSPNLRPVMSEVAIRIEEIRRSTTGNKHSMGSNA